MRDIRFNLVKILDKDTSQKKGRIQGATVLKIISCFLRWANSACDNEHPVNQGTAKRNCPYCWVQLKANQV